MITDEQVQAAIAVLRAYVDGTLQTNLCDELDEALEKAFDAWNIEQADRFGDYDGDGPVD